MLALIEKIASQGGVTREQVRKETRSRRPAARKPTPSTSGRTSKAFSLRLSFAKKTASKDEIISALENILEELRKQ